MIRREKFDMNPIQIKDIYVGKPDAKDEYAYDPNRFLSSFVLPPEFPCDKIIDGEKYLVSGYKGVGKTTVLYFLKSEIEKKYPKAVASMIRFRSDFEENKRRKINTMAEDEFLYVWRALFFQKIVSECDGKSLVRCPEWDQFKNEVKKISFINSESFGWKGDVRFSLNLPVVNLNVSAETEGVTGKSIIEKNEGIIDECMRLYRELPEFENPLYLLVDELEADYESVSTLKRDLKMIRDLLRVIQQINSISRNVRAIAAVRTEIIASMDRFISTKELNKMIDGCEVRLNWNVPNYKGVEHPLIQILMKRIQVSGDESPEFVNYFPRTIKKKDTINFILDNGWGKPRDIVRFLLAAQNMYSTKEKFDGEVILGIQKSYSESSWKEIVQELQSLYKAEEIDYVAGMLRGGYEVTDAEGIKKGAAKGSKARKFWDTKEPEILEDFYRVGVWGNVCDLGGKRRWRWNHKGDTGVLRREGWRLVIHPALRKVLSIQEGIYKDNSPI